LKEQYMIRAGGHGTTLPLPGRYPIPGKVGQWSAHFGESSLKLYQYLDQTCRQSLYKVADVLALPHQNVDKLLDPVSKDVNISIQEKEKGIYICSTSYMHPGYVSSSMLDVFRYGNTFSTEDKSDQKFKNNHSSHSDSGILTIVPVADVPGLEVHDQLLDSWIALEKIIHVGVDNYKNFGTIFWGDSFEYLTKTHVKACMHRVEKSDKTRYSIVFKQRTKPTATAPRYQEDYDIAVMQQRSLNKVHGKSVFYRVIVPMAIIGAGIILFNRFRRSH